MSPEAVKAAQTKFFQSCGDSYVSGAQIGGEFVALLTYTAKDETDKSSFEAAFSASGMGFSADADFSKKASAFRSQMGLAMESTQVGGSGGPTANTVDAIMAYSLIFNAGLKPDNAALIEFQTDKYSNLGINAADYDDLKEQVDNARRAREAKRVYPPDRRPPAHAHTLRNRRRPQRRSPAPCKRVRSGTRAARGLREDADVLQRPAIAVAVCRTCSVRRSDQ